MQILVVEFQMAASEEVFYVSAATIWEIAVKSRLGKVNPETKYLDQEVAANRFPQLAISARHALQPGTYLCITMIRLIHGDRTGQLEDLRIGTHDETFARHKLGVLWT